MNAVVTDTPRTRMFRLMSWAGFGTILAMAAGYIFYSAAFAERHIILPGLPFPIFVGEILLGGCLLFWSLQQVLARRPFRWSMVTAGWALYGLWILARAGTGYVGYGALAFRSAALFYYGFFAFLGYAFYPRGFFRLPVLLALAAGIGLAVKVLGYQGYFWFTFFCLYVVLTAKLRPAWLRYAAWVLIPVFFDLRIPFQDNRSCLVGSLGAMGLLGYDLLFVRLQLSWLWRVVVLGVLGLTIVTGIYLYADHNGLQTLVNPGEVLRQWRVEQARIDAERPMYQLKPMKIQLYHSNQELVQEQRERSRELEAEERMRFQQSHAVETADRNTGTAQVETSGILSEGKEMDSRQDPEPKKASPLNPVSEPNPAPPDQAYRSLDVAYVNSLFRLFIWRDMAVDMMKDRAVFGESFGKPQRSPSLEILHWAESEIQRTGWITPHNSFLHMIYRGGVIGLALVMVILSAWLRLLRLSLRRRDTVGVWLAAALLYWLILANFILAFELPYHAIPFWTLFGMSWAYLHREESA